MTKDRLQQEIDRRVSAGEIAHALRDPISDAEREDVLALIRWFTRRYPTGEARLAYVRRAYARWRAANAAR